MSAERFSQRAEGSNNNNKKNRITHQQHLFLTCRPLTIKMLLYHFRFPDQNFFIVFHRAFIVWYCVIFFFFLLLFSFDISPNKCNNVPVAESCVFTEPIVYKRRWRDRIGRFTIDNRPWHVLVMLSPKNMSCSGKSSVNRSNFL